MKQLTTLALSALFVFGTSVAFAEDVKSGPQAGDPIGAFYVTKVCGAESDGVDAGKNLCYRCKNGARPQVMVFTRSAEKGVADLVQGLDKAVAENSEKQLRVFVNVLSDSKDGAEEELKKLASESKAENIPFVVPNEVENGPEDYGLNSKAAVTVILASKGKVVASHAFSSAKDVNVKAVLGDLSQIVN